MKQTAEKINLENPVRNELTEKIIGCSFKVMNELGSGFLEKVYENALKIELNNAGLKTTQQKPIEVRYGGHLVGEYVADLLVEDNIIIELKAVRNLDDVHIAQCLNYLKATGYQVCMLFNFGQPTLQFKRILSRSEWIKE